MTAGLDPERQGSSSGRAKAAAEDVAVAESWLASDGRVRGLDLHWQRFEPGMPMRGFGPACRGQRSSPRSRSPGAGSRASTRVATASSASPPGSPPVFQGKQLAQP